LRKLFCAYLRDDENAQGRIVEDAISVDRALREQTALRMHSGSRRSSSPKQASSPTEKLPVLSTDYKKQKWDVPESSWGRNSISSRAPIAAADGPHPSGGLRVRGGTLG
jgi:hypothetical protein